LNPTVSDEIVNVLLLLWAVFGIFNLLMIRGENGPYVILISSISLWLWLVLVDVVVQGAVIYAHFMPSL
jgi:hypothetical protein